MSDSLPVTERVMGLESPQQMKVDESFMREKICIQSQITSLQITSLCKEKTSKC